MKCAKLGSYYDDFVVGEVVQHQLSKTIFESDNNLFSLITMNHHPLHTNQDYAATQQHNKIVVVGTLVFSLAVGISVPDISGKAIANLEYSDVVHVAPVFVGDTIYVSTEILEKGSSKSKFDRGIVSVQSSVVNQNNELVLTFSRRVLIKKRTTNAT